MRKRKPSDRFDPAYYSEVNDVDDYPSSLAGKPRERRKQTASLLPIQA